jgi:hypothetical protein
LPRTNRNGFSAGHFQHVKGEEIETVKTIWKEIISEGANRDGSCVSRAIGITDISRCPTHDKQQICKGEKIMKWVTRQHVHVDRTACPWLIKKFVDPKAEFIFVPAEKIEEIVKKEKAIPFDAPSVELGHHGDKCSFDAIIEKYKITDAAVLELAKIVRAADSDKPQAVPEAPGLDAVMTGFSTAAKDDHEAIAKTSSAYDAFYTSCKLKLIREKHKVEIEKMDKKRRREFLRGKLLK